MKVTIVKNGSIRMVVSPESDSERSDLETMAKMDVQIILTKQAMAIIDVPIPEGSMIIQSKSLGNSEQS